MRCPICRADNQSGATACQECGETLSVETKPKTDPANYPIAQAQADEDDVMDVLPAREQDDEEDDDAYSSDGGISTLIPYRNPKALAAYYLGLFALIPVVGLLTAPFAVIFGIMGVRAARKDAKAKGTIHALIGIVFGSLALLCSTSLVYLILISKNREAYRLFFTGGY